MTFDKYKAIRDRDRRFGGEWTPVIPTETRGVHANGQSGVSLESRLGTASTTRQEVGKSTEAFVQGTKPTTIFQPLRSKAMKLLQAIR